jgi:hypothetical protein
VPELIAPAATLHLLGRLSMSEFATSTNAPENIDAVCAVTAKKICGPILFAVQQKTDRCVSRVTGQCNAL